MSNVVSMFDARMIRAINGTGNMLGNPLTHEARDRVLDCVRDPNPETWKAARSVVLAPTGMGYTLWQAVLAAAPDYDSGVPTRDQLVAAIAYAAETNTR